MKKRIWELDCLRGLFLINMIAFHFAYDLVHLFGLVELTHPILRLWYRMGNDWGGTPFLFISGVCVTFSSRPLRRGLQVIGGGLIVSLVTVGMYLLHFADKSIIIYFGVLHCIGVCMLLWPLFRKLPSPVLLVLGIVMAVGGLYLKNNVRVDFPWLIPFGVPSYSFASSDYFPLLPNLGYFLIGSVLGRKLYPARRTLFPRVNDRNPLIRFFGFFGEHSLLIYLLHQPVLAALISLWTFLEAHL